MEKHFVNFNQSLALKEIGFDEPCISWYTVFGKFSNDYSNPKKYNSEYERGSFISAPLKSQVFEWFRKTYNIHNVPLGTVRNSDNKVVYHIGKPNTISLYTKLYDTYEEAESACIDKLIEIIKTK